MLRRLHEALVATAPTLGARVAHAATVGRNEGPDAGLAMLDAMADARVARFQPAWATRAHLLAEAGRSHEAAEAWDTAAGLTRAGPVCEYLLRRRAEIRP